MALLIIESWGMYWRTQEDVQERYALPSAGAGGSCQVYATSAQREECAFEPPVMALHHWARLVPMLECNELLQLTGSGSSPRGVVLLGGGAR